MDDFKKKQIMIGAVAFFFGLIFGLAILVAVVDKWGVPGLAFTAMAGGVASYLWRKVK